MGADGYHGIAKIQHVVIIGVHAINIKTGFVISFLTVATAIALADIVFGTFFRIVKTYGRRIRGGYTGPTTTIIIVGASCSTCKIKSTDFIFRTVTLLSAFDTSVGVSGMETNVLCACAGVSAPISAKIVIITFIAIICRSTITVFGACLVALLVSRSLRIYITDKARITIGRILTFNTIVGSVALLALGTVCVVKAFNTVVSVLSSTQTG